MLLCGEVGLALGLGADGDEERAAFADLAVEVAPGFELGDAVGAPAAAEKVDDEGAEGEEIAASDEVAGGVLQLEVGRLCSYGEDAVLDAGGEELFDGSLADGEAVGGHELAGAGGDGVELVLEISGHCLSEGIHGR